MGDRMKPAEHTPEELDNLRKSDRTYFLTLFRDMLVAHAQAGRTLPQVVAYIDRTIDNIEKRERAA